MTPPKVEPPEALGGSGRAAGKADTAIVADLERKRRARLAALLALAGFELHELKSGEFLVCRWGLQRFCHTLDEAEAFARQVGAMR